MNPARVVVSEMRCWCRLQILSFSENAQPHLSRSAPFLTFPASTMSIEQEWQVTLDLAFFRRKSQNDGGFNNLALGSPGAGCARSWCWGWVSV